MFFKNIEVSGIRRIVINRVQVFEQVDGTNPKFPWVKTEGGPGFKATPVRRLSAGEMKHKVDRLLEKQVTIDHWHGQEIVAEQYRAWVHGDTLNIVEIKRARTKITVMREVR